MVRDQKQSNNWQSNQYVKQQAQKRKAPAGSKSATNKQAAIKPQEFNRNLVILTGLVACVLVVVLNLYPVIREYYVAVRTNEQLSAELLAVQERNQKIQDQIDNLRTTEGIEDRVREEFGWVKSGEVAVNITGLDITDSTTVLPDQVKAGDIAAQDNWWTDFLDSLFSIEKPKDPEPIPDPFFGG